MRRRQFWGKGTTIAATVSPRTGRLTNILSESHEREVIGPEMERHQEPRDGLMDSGLSSYVTSIIDAVAVRFSPQSS